MDEVCRGELTLTFTCGHVRMQSASPGKRARSSMAEQWPFKPLVESSNLSALTPKSSIGGFFGFPRRGLIYGRLFHHLRKDSDHLGVKVPARFLLDIVHCVTVRPGVPVGAVGGQRIIDVHGGEQARRSAGSVPRAARAGSRCRPISHGGIAGSPWRAPGRGWA